MMWLWLLVALYISMLLVSVLSRLFFAPAGRADIKAVRLVSDPVDGRLLVKVVFADGQEVIAIEESGIDPIWHVDHYAAAEDIDRSRQAGRRVS